MTKRNQKYVKATSNGNAHLTVAQTLTGTWAACGPEINVQDYDMITLWLAININNSLNAQFKLVLMMASGGTEYSLPILNVGTDRVKFQPEYYELDVDGTDTNIVERFGVTEASHVKLYIKAGTVGSPAGIMTSVYFDLSTAIA